MNSEAFDESEAFSKWLPMCPGGSTARPWEVYEWGTRLADTEGETFWELLVKHWSGFDFIPHEAFAGLFARFRGSAPRAGIPDKLKIFRGQDDSSMPGLSWTTDRKVAKLFAEGHRGTKNPNPIILTLEVTGDEIAFRCDEREESEIVLFEIILGGDVENL